MSIEGVVPFYLPIWATFVLTASLSLAAMEVGMFLGRRRSRALTGEPTDQFSSLQGGMLGLVAFMLAITFGTQLSRFDSYRQLELEEATTIHATWLRADMLPAPYRERVKQLLEQYVSIRIDAVRSTQLGLQIKRSEALQDEIWAEAVMATEKASEAFPRELFMESLTQLVTLHERRLAVGLYQRMPLVFWLTLIFLTTISMAVTGYHSGSIGASRSVVHVVTVLTFSLLVLLIADLNRPESGMLTANQLPLIDARKRMIEAGL